MLVGLDGQKGTSTALSRVKLNENESEWGQSKGGREIATGCMYVEVNRFKVYLHALGNRDRNVDVRSATHFRTSSL